MSFYLHDGWNCCTSLILLLIISLGKIVQRISRKNIAFISSYCRLYNVAVVAKWM